MDKPNSKSELARYLAAHPHLRYESENRGTTAGQPKVEGRTFSRMQDDRFIVFHRATGEESRLIVDDVQFYGDRFAVPFLYDWGPERDAKFVLHYYYLDAPYRCPDDFEEFLTAIGTGHYDDERGLDRFRAEILAHYGHRHAAALDGLVGQHADLQGRARLEEVLNDFVKVI